VFGWESVETDRGSKEGAAANWIGTVVMAVVERRPLAGHASVRHRAHQFVSLLETGSARAGFAGKSRAEPLWQDLWGLRLCAIEARAGYVRLLKTLYCSDVATHSLLARSTSISL
jgi:hypothetical protein